MSDKQRTNLDKKNSLEPSAEVKVKIYIFENKRG